MGLENPKYDSNRRQTICARTPCYEVIGWGDFEESEGLEQDEIPLKLCLVQIAYRGIVAFSLSPEDQLNALFPGWTRHPKNVFEDKRGRSRLDKGEDFELQTAVGYSKLEGVCSAPSLWLNFENGGLGGMNYYQIKASMCCAVVLVKWDDGERLWINVADHCLPSNNPQL